MKINPNISILVCVVENCGECTEDIALCEECAEGFYDLTEVECGGKQGIIHGKIIPSYGNPWW